MRDGDRVEPPWILHADGTRDRLLVQMERGRATEHGRGLVWELRLDDPVWAERVHVRFASAWGRKGNAFGEAMRTLDDAGGVADAKPTHRYTSDGARTWWRYQTHRRRDGLSVGHEWIEPPDPPILRALGEQVYRAQCAMIRAAGRARLAGEVLHAAVRRRLGAPREVGARILTIGGHLYGYHAIRNRWRALEWGPWFTWPESGDAAFRAETWA